MKFRAELLLIPIFVTCLVTGSAPQDASTKSWSGWEFLIGEWNMGEGGGAPGQASAGFFSLTPDLGGNILVRKSHSEYPAANGKPAVVHDDLIVVFHEGDGIKALYTDSEGHAIHYDVSFSADGKQITFLSGQAAGQSQYRLIYQDLGKDTVKVSFEIAPPNKPGQFSKYVDGVLHRKKA